MRIIPITYRYASDFVNQYHRHHKAPQGCKFAVGLKGESGIVGVAICGRPVSRELDDGYTLEITRVCTNGVENGCSMLYGACCRIAKEMGYEKVATYILKSENGSSLKASNFIYDGEAGKPMWTGSRKRDNGVPLEKKKRYVYYTKRRPE